ncbi:uncharacterized protein LOC109841651 [Asparagus officinalis]|uniref:uncharacterized protein LOC109841651 n=1 Tax=Asparagus officinalis TaxID=4686 RepID=UPI00098E268C|nr:uncharacterized protein LOC109841651 [Asparagus officinalis]
MRPPSFSSAEGPLAVEEFLKVTETILTVTRIAPAEWVDLMDIQLTDTAQIWWTVEKAHLERPISWETFTDRFNRKYFPQSARDELLRRFVELKQGGRIVDDYEAEFSLAGRALTTHDAVLDAAREIESVLKEPEDPHVIQSRTLAAPSRNVERPPPRQQQQAPQRQQDSQRQPFHQAHPYQHLGVQSQSQSSVRCSYCRCRKRLRLCFNCGSPDHLSPNCPQKQQARLPPPPVRAALPAPPRSDSAALAQYRPYPRAGPLPPQQQVYKEAHRQQPRRQMFMMSAVEAEENNQVITGENSSFLVLFACELPYFVLPDDIMI